MRCTSMKTDLVVVCIRAGKFHLFLEHCGTILGMVMLEVESNLTWKELASVLYNEANHNFV